MNKEKQDTISLSQWLDSDIGHYIMHWETQKIDQIVSNCFGFQAVQVGLANWDLLIKNRIPTKTIVTEENNYSSNTTAQKVIVSSYTSLPFPDRSIDLLILPHSLEFSDHPHQVLHEANRVLVYEGRLVITGFNPHSLWAWRDRWLRSTCLPISSERMVSVARMKDWCKLLTLDIDRGEFGCYALTSGQNKWISRWQALEKAGNRWWPLTGGIYLLSAYKRAKSLQPVGRIRQKIKKGQTSLPVAPASGKIAVHPQENEGKSW